MWGAFTLTLLFASRPATQWHALQLEAEVASEERVSPWHEASGSSESEGHPLSKSFCHVK